MNIITKGDVKKFLKLVKVGMKYGTNKELKNFSSNLADKNNDGDQKYYVSLDFSFSISKNIIDGVFIDDDFDVSNEIKKLVDEL